MANEHKTIAEWWQYEYSLEDVVMAAKMIALAGTMTAILCGARCYAEDYHKKHPTPPVKEREYYEPSRGELINCG